MQDRGVCTYLVQAEVVSSTIAPRITIFSKGGLLAPESISKSTMVIMSWQLLFIYFLALFCHFFGPFIIFSKLKTI